MGMGTGSEAAKLTNDPKIKDQPILRQIIGTGVGVDV